jgi:release factor glutamine methyltransferase
MGDASDRLSANGVSSPRHDAEELAAHLLGVGRSQLWRFHDDPPPAGYDELVGRRADRVPLQHLTGRAYFRRLTLQVGPGVFVPRPETEVVVQHALDLMQAAGTERPVVVDVCSGSGAIAASLATERTDAVVHAVEADPAAVVWLRRNLAGTSVTVHDCDLDETLPGVVGGVDLVVANPPYIPERSVPRDPEVARHDPAVALYSGPDGLDHVRRIERVAGRLLRPGGWAVVEHADEQGASAPQVFGDHLTWDRVTDHRDLTGRPRVVTARRSRPVEVQ